MKAITDLKNETECLIKVRYLFTFKLLNPLAHWCVKWKKDNQSGANLVAKETFISIMH